jgi:hypothetical protein
LQNKKTFLCCFAVLFLGFRGNASIIPSQELSVWQNKYPKNALVSIAKNLSVDINLVNGELETTTEQYREMIVLTDNAVFLADSKEYFNSHYVLNKFEAYSLVPEIKQYKKIPVSKYTKTIEIDDYVFYDDQVVYNYTFPSVGKGTKLITRTSATTKYAFTPFVFDFGGGIPNENMSVTLSIPRNAKIIYHLFGMDTAMIRFNKTIRGDRIIYSWQANNSKTYEADDKTPDSRYYIPHLVIQIAGYTDNKVEKPVIGSLKDLYNYNYSHISNLSVEIAPDIKILADSLSADCINDREKVRNIFRWVQKHIKYVAIEDGDNGLVPSEASLVLRRRYGDCKGKTSLLVSLIKSQGLKASFAWVGSRTRPYRYSEFPSVVNDDHMIAVWWDNDKPVILDGTTYSHQMEDIPSFIQGKECLIEKGKEDYMLYEIPVAPAWNNAIIDSVYVRLEGNTLVGSGVITFFGENKANLIRYFEGKDSSKYKEILARQLTKASNKHTVKSVTISDINNIEQPFAIKYSFVLPDFITKNNNNTYVSLNIDRFLHQTVLKEDRSIPVESEITMEYKLYCNLLIPEGLRLKSLPDSSSYQNPLFGFSEKYTADNKTVMLNSSITINFQVIDGDSMNKYREMLTLLNRNYLRSLSLEKTEIL